MSYHFLCKRGIRPARTEQFLVYLSLYSFFTTVALRNRTAEKTNFGLFHEKQNGFSSILQCTMMSLPSAADPVPPSHYLTVYNDEFTLGG